MFKVNNWLLSNAFKFYFFMLFTGIRIDDPGNRTLSFTINKGNLLGIVMDDAIFDVLENDSNHVISYVR